MPARSRAGVVAAALVALAFAAMPIASAHGAAVPSPGVPQNAGPALTLPTVVRHVIVVLEENHDLKWTMTSPGFKSLSTLNAHATSAYATCHPSAPNYLALTSATVTQCGSDAVNSYGLTNLGSDVAAHGGTWQGLMESMPSACDRSDAYPYIAHHNPWIYYSKLKTSCAANDLSFFAANGSSRLKSELAAGTLPTLTFVSPNMLDDAHDGSLSVASTWLAKNVLKPVNASANYSTNTAVFVVFDEAYQQACNCSQSGGFTAGGVTVAGGPIYLVVVSPIPPATLALSGNVCDFNVVHTIEWLLALPSLGHDDNASFPALKGLFK